MGFRIAMVYNILIVIPFEMIWKPMMMEYRNDKNIKELFKKITYYYTLISIILIMFCAFFIDNIMEFIRFNNSYSLSVVVIPFIMGGVFLSSLQNIFSAGIFYSRKPILLLAIYLPIGFISIFLNIMFIPLWGIWGVVLAGLISRFLLSIAVYIVSSKYFKIDLGYKRYLKILLIISLVILLHNQLSVIFGSDLKLDILSYIIFILLGLKFLLNSNEKIVIRKILRVSYEH
jgi:O-antigen/teichoic acid export membrane protein